MKLTIVVAKGEEFFLGSIKEIPEVLTQGTTVEEAKENVLDALQLYLETMQQTSMQNTVLEEDLIFA